MDPVTAFANIIIELTKLATAIVESQPPEVRKQIWEWYVQDIKFWRKVFKVENL